MKQLSRSVDGITASLSRDELLILKAALNETANGIYIEEFSTRVGYELTQVRELLKEVAAIADAIEVNSR